MDEIGAARQRVESARRLAGLLGVCWDVFGVIASACRAREERAGELFAAFMFAGVAADEARLALASAPSLPAPGGLEDLGGAPGTGPVEEVADALADLARAVAGRLTSAAADAAGPGDQAACREAAGAAYRAARLLSRSGR